MAETFLESLKVERRRLEGLIVELVDGKLVTDDRVTGTSAKLSRIKRIVAELSVLITAYEAEDA